MCCRSKHLCKPLKKAHGLPLFIPRLDTPVPSFIMTDLGHLPIQVPLHSFAITDPKLCTKVSVLAEVLSYIEVSKKIFYLRYPLRKLYQVKDLTKERKKSILQIDHGNPELLKSTIDLSIKYAWPWESDSWDLSQIYWIRLSRKKCLEICIINKYSIWLFIA